MSSFTKFIASGSTLAGCGPVTSGMVVRVHGDQLLGAPALRGDFTLVSSIHAGVMEHHLGDELSHSAFVAVQNAMPQSGSLGNFEAIHAALAAAVGGERMDVVNKNILGRDQWALVGVDLKRGCPDCPDGGADRGAPVGGEGVQKPRKDILFTEDALDADNFAAARAVAEYANTFDGEVHVWLDVSTAKRDLSQPAFAFPMAEMSGTKNGFMGNVQPFYIKDHAAITIDTRLCQYFDAHVLLEVCKKYADKDVHFHVLLGEPTQQLLWDQIIPRTYVAIDYDTESRRLVVDEGGYKNKLKELDGVVSYTAPKAKFGVYDYTKIEESGTRRSLHRKYLETKIAKFDKMEVATNDEFIHGCGNDVDIILCAPLTNAAILISQLAPEQITNVVGELKTLRPSDNVVNAQFNEALDPAAATQVFTTLARYQKIPFVTPTQCFNVKEPYPGVLEEVRKVMIGLQNTLAVSESTEFISSYQKFWNGVKRGPQAVFDPLCVLYLSQPDLFQCVKYGGVSLPEKFTKGGGEKVKTFYNALYS